jgi:6,7-dimethyl-8-ribityllumazine synthase
LKKNSPQRHPSAALRAGSDTEKNNQNNFVVESAPKPALSTLEGSINASGKWFAIVVSRFNAFITERLLLSAVDGLVRSGATKDDIDVVRVPGAFEIPLAARKLAETGKYDAVICIGCLLRGDTAHYDVIVNEVTRGIGQSAQETGIPHAFGVLTCENLEQAIDRAGLKMGNKGFEAALAAVEMASLKEAIGPRAPVGGRQQSGGGHLSSAVGEQQIPRSARNDKSNLRNDKADLRNGKSKKKLHGAETKHK